MAAIYHLNASVGTKAKGQSAAAAAAYDVRARKYTNRDGEHFVGAVHGNMPYWAVGVGRHRERAGALAYWDAVDAYERTNGVLYREIEFSLPDEMSVAQQQAVAVEFANEVATVEGGKLPYTMGFHAKWDASTGRLRNFHAHLKLSERINDGLPRYKQGWFRRAANVGTDPAGGGARKAQIQELGRGWLIGTRERWAKVGNEHLTAAGLEPTLDHRSLVDQGIDREPMVHEGWTSTKNSRRALNVDIRRRNALGAELRAAQAAVEVARAEFDLAGRDLASSGGDILTMPAEACEEARRGAVKQRVAVALQTPSLKRPLVNRLAAACRQHLTIGDELMRRREVPAHAVTSVGVAVCEEDINAARLTPFDLRQKLAQAQRDQLNDQAKLEALGLCRIFAKFELKGAMKVRSVSIDKMTTLLGVAEAMATVTSLPYALSKLDEDTGRINRVRMMRVSAQVEVRGLTHQQSTTPTQIVSEVLERSTEVPQPMWDFGHDHDHEPEEMERPRGG